LACIVFLSQKRNGTEQLCFCLAVYFIDNNLNENITAPFRLADSSEAGFTVKQAQT